MKQRRSERPRAQVPTGKTRVRRYPWGFRPLPPRTERCELICEDANGTEQKTPRWARWEAVVQHVDGQVRYVMCDQCRGYFLTEMTGDKAAV